MSKNYNKSHFNIDEPSFPQNYYSSFSHKISDKISDIIINNKNEFNFFYQQPKDIINILSNYYTKKEKTNNNINDFLEKITILNKTFFSYSEKYLSTKETLIKLNDELFMNLFKQINYYVEEIQRLNKKIIFINNKDYKKIIKKLTKEIYENKEMIKNYEIKIKEKNIKEVKLKEEIEYYKRRIIFFKNKININLISRNINNSNQKLKKNKDLEKKRIKSSKSILQYRSFNSEQILNNMLISSPERKIKITNRMLFCNKSPGNKTIISERKSKKTKLFSNIINNSKNEFQKNKNLIIVNVEKFRGNITERKNENYSCKNLIKTNKKYFKKKIFSSYNNSKHNIMKNKNLKKYINRHWNKYFKHNKNKSKIIVDSHNFSILNSSFGNQSNYSNKLTEINNTKDFVKFPSSNDLTNTIFNVEDIFNKMFRPKNFTIYNSNSNQKLEIKRKIYNLISKNNNSTNLNQNYNSITNFRLNTINGNNINNNNIFNYSNKIDKNKYDFKIKKQIFKRNNYDIIQKSLLNSNNIKNINENNSPNEYKISKDKNRINNNNHINNNYQNKEKTFINVNKKNLEKETDKIRSNQKELIKLFQDINEDYNNDIDILNNQENQIKFLLNLIDLKDK